jgi:hypothetical protein
MNVLLMIDQTANVVWKSDLSGGGCMIIVVRVVFEPVANWPGQCRTRTVKRAIEQDD